MKYCWCFFIVTLIYSQNLTMLNQDQKNVSFRALSVVSPSIIWIGGSNGVIGKSTNGGSKFTWMIQKEYEKNEFRDIQAFDKDSCIAMAITEPAVIIETTNGGKSFKKKFEDSDKKAFFDAFDCRNFDNCTLVGDAVVPNELYMLTKQNGKWRKRNNTYNTRNGEVFFAASGSNIQMFDDLNFMAVSGGSVSRIIYNYNDVAFHQILDILQGTESSGANGLYYDEEDNLGIIVGGDFTKPEESMFNMVLFRWDNKMQNFAFELPAQAPVGYKSSVCRLNEKLWVCCGLSGIDYSKDAGQTWIHFSDDAYHVIEKRSEYSAILAGPEGKIALLEF